MKDQGRGGGGLGAGYERVPRSKWGRRSPYGPAHQSAEIDEARRHSPTYAALDLGTNNCRLLVARPAGDSFRVIDAFSRIIRLGAQFRF